ncbi:MAG: hypothetical protein U9N34_10960, partial [Candidatus Cloacimonadota bacterium]|nr:hypothetical protein [Candidatus Cloacimonadota bacterium]
SGSANIYLSHSDIEANVFDPDFELLGVKNLSFMNKRIESATENSLGSSNFAIALAEEDMQFFDKEEIFVGVECEMDESNGEVLISPNDYINVKARIEAEIRIDIEE